MYGNLAGCLRVNSALPWQDASLKMPFLSDQRFAEVNPVNPAVWSARQTQGFLVFVVLISRDVCSAPTQQASYLVITKLGGRLQTGTTLGVGDINFCTMVK